MQKNILAVGDVTGPAGLGFLCENLPAVKKNYNADFVVVNGENAAGLGLTIDNANRIFDAGADVITLGNHTWSQREIIPFLDDCRYIIRPANFAPQVPGKGWGIFETNFGNVCVINLIGRANMPVDNDNPFIAVNNILGQVEEKIILVDFHAEMTSEKFAMAYHLDGRVSAVWGTHTHVQTSDICVFSGGTGYITDLGMTGPIDSIIGMKPASPVSSFLGNPPERFVPATGPARLEGAVFSIDTKTGKCVSAQSLRVD
jgi:metallophosphoesterase (TIGR00282 family)